MPSLGHEPKEVRYASNISRSLRPEAKKAS